MSFSSQFCSSVAPSAPSDNLPHDGVNVKEAQFGYKGPSQQNCLQCESYGIWLKGKLHELETIVY